MNWAPWPFPTLKPPSGIPVRASRTSSLARGLVGCWLFNEGAGRPFELITQYQPSLVGNVGWGASSRGLGMTFDGAGAGAYLNLDTGLPASQKVGTGSFTLSTLAIHSSIGTANHYRKDNGTPRALYLTRLETTGKFSMFAGRSSFPSVSSTTVAVVNRPYLVQGTRDTIANTLTISVDGTEEASGAGAGAGEDLETGGTVRIGDSGSGSEPMVGLIVYVLLHNYVMPISLRRVLHAEPYALIEVPEAVVPWALALGAAGLRRLQFQFRVPMVA